MSSPARLPAADLFGQITADLHEFGSSSTDTAATSFDAGQWSTFAELGARDLGQSVQIITRGTQLYNALREHPALPLVLATPTSVSPGAPSLAWLPDSSIR